MMKEGSRLTGGAGEQYCDTQLTRCQEGSKITTGMNLYYNIYHSYQEKFHLDTEQILNSK